MLRTLANDLRAKAANQAVEKREKAGQVLIAATGLGLLRAKLGGARG
jgi:hypothetical protein